MSTFTSIIVLCFNGLQEATRPCVESILQNTPEGEYELILVDNASTDSTSLYLQELVTKYRHIQICLNTVNRGFAGGNNDGMQLAVGTFIVLLNNDTLVPMGWLEALLKLLTIRKDVGLVGPVTNSAGNEQRIDLPGLNERNFKSIAQGYVQRQHGEWFFTEKLGFFCVALRSTLINEIGNLDEQFGAGMFEDDDFSLRVKKAGYKLAVVEDCFVFHKGSISFAKLDFSEYRELFERNKVCFSDKHAVNWTFSDIAFAYLKKFDRDLKVVARSSHKDPALERILMRWESFRHLIVQIHQVECQVTGGLTTISACNAMVTKSRWIVRWNVFKTNFINGTNSERWRYVRLVFCIIVDRFIQR